MEGSKYDGRSQLHLLLLFLLFPGLEMAAVSSTQGAGSGHGACCDICLCSKAVPPDPPQCWCQDVRTYCLPTCKLCRCTKSIPPQCTCADAKDNCDPPCSLSAA